MTTAGSTIPTATATATAAAAAAPARKSNPGSPWTDQETSHLIDAYEERWYSLKRGQLKAQQWEEVAAQVSGRCGFSFPSKNGTQCRHKIEKLRKRYRSDRLRSARSAWPFFDRIDRMERGPVPICALRVESDEEEYCGSNMRSIDGILREDFSRVARGLGKRRKLSDVEEKEEEEEEDEEEEEEMEVREVAVELRRFGEDYVKMERRRMDVMREMEREWMEMEAKRMEMIMEAQKGFVESIARAFSNKGKNSVEM